MAERGAMKVIMVMVSSVNGRITKGDNPDVTAFASKEDAALFLNLKERFPCYILGSSTFEASRKRIILRKGHLRVVMTANPEKYTAEVVPGRLEFTRETPERLVKRLASEGYKRALLLGGSRVNRSFLEAGLVDELYLTIEPALFGKGKNLIEESDINVPLRLVRVKRLNTSGTLHARYKVIT